jgi:hypothetical protein
MPPGSRLTRCQTALTVKVDQDIQLGLHLSYTEATMHQTIAPKSDKIVLTINVGKPTRRKAKNTGTRAFGDRRLKRLKTRSNQFRFAQEG